MLNANPLQPRQKIGLARFTLIRQLGQGGMGVVWLAQDEKLGESVALKFLPPEVRADPVALDDLRRETLRSRKLSHPHIVRIHDFHEVEGEAPFISVEYVDGPNLVGLRMQQAERVVIGVRGHELSGSRMPFLSPFDLGTAGTPPQLRAHIHCECRHIKV